MNTAVDQMKSLQRKNQVQLIASYLMRALRIPNGNHLVLFFGTGNEQNNRQALVHWIEMHLDEIDPDDAEERLKYLASQVTNTNEVQVCDE